MASAGSTVEVTASAKEGYVLVGKSTWKHTFATPVGCDQGGGGEGNPPGDHQGNNPGNNQGNDPGDNQGTNQSTNPVGSASPAQKAQLPHTGAADQVALGAGALGLLALGSLLLRVSRRPEGVTALG
jgi:LPXTG-motif cell wall-anchored protein